MVSMRNRPEVDRNRLLYDPMTLEQHLDRYGTPMGIKLNVMTTARQYEIRTAVRYWFGGAQSYRTADRVWDTCEAIDDDQWALDDNNEIVYADDV